MEIIVLAAIIYIAVKFYKSKAISSQKARDEVYVSGSQEDVQKLQSLVKDCYEMRDYQWNHMVQMQNMNRRYLGGNIAMEMGKNRRIKHGS